MPDNPASKKPIEANPAPEAEPTNVREPDNTRSPSRPTPEPAKPNAAEEDDEADKTPEGMG